MNVVRRAPWTRERFLDWAECQDGRFEFDGTEPVDVTGGSILHGLILSNLHFALRSCLSDAGPFVVMIEAGVATRGTAIRYPDALVADGSMNEQARLVTAPRVVFEVISPSTERTDRVTKLSEYAAVPGLLRYVVIDTDRIGATVHDRTDDGAPWRTAVLGAPGDVLHFPEIGADMPLADLYRFTSLARS